MIHFHINPKHLKHHYYYLFICLFSRRTEWLGDLEKWWRSVGCLGDHIQMKQSKQMLQPLLSEYLTLTDIQM